MLPPHERLEPGDLSRRQRDNGLIVQAEFASLDGPAQVCLELQSGNGPVPHLAVEYLAACAAARLGSVHCRVRIPQHGFGRLIVRCARGDPDTGSGEDLLSVQGERHRERFLHTLGHAERIADVADVLQQHGELVTAESSDRMVQLEPRYRVARSQAPLQPPCDRHQQLVSHDVAEAVVDQLEAIQIQEQHREHVIPVAPCPFDRRREAIDEQNPVR